MNLRSPLGRARGLGSSKDGVAHFWGQRLSAVALVPLVVWFVIAVIALSGADYGTVRAWFAAPFNATVLALVVVVTFYHAQLGLQVVIEDYVHCEAAKFASLIGVKLIAAFLAVYGLVSVLKLATGG